VQDGRPEWGTLEVVGVVGDVRFEDLAEPSPPLVYVPVLGPTTPRDMTRSFWAVRTSGPPPALSGAVRAQITSLRPDIPVASMAPLQQSLAASTASLRLAMWLLVAASVAAVLLSAVGVYGVVAYAASQRLGELGVRMALGARSADIRELVLFDGALATGCGLALGVATSLLVGRLVDSLLYGVSGLDPVIHVTVALGLGVTALSAALIPARRAARLDPATVLRREP
ncbi:MAG: FtsX-like permease family protein, partial [Acidobacteriota bacterium]